MAESELPIPNAQCPVCGATDAFTEPLREGDEYYVECVNCHVYRASRRAYRLFQYLRGKGDTDSLQRLERLAHVLHARGRGTAARLEYDDWEQL